MNIRVTLEVDGPADEVTAWLAKLPSSAGASVSATVWTPELAKRLIRRVSDKAATALAIMSDHAPVISFEQLQGEMELDGIRIGGVLASFGFAENAGFPRPYTVDREQRVYIMDPDVARVINEAFADEDD